MDAYIYSICICKDKIIKIDYLPNHQQCFKSPYNLTIDRNSHIVELNFSSPYISLSKTKRKPNYIRRIQITLANKNKHQNILMDFKLTYFMNLCVLVLEKPPPQIHYYHHHHRLIALILIAFR